LFSYFLLLPGYFFVCFVPSIGRFRRCCCRIRHRQDETCCVDPSNLRHGPEKPGHFQYDISTKREALLSMSLPLNTKKCRFRSTPKSKCRFRSTPKVSLPLNTKKCRFRSTPKNYALVGPFLVLRALLGLRLFWLELFCAQFFTLSPRLSYLLPRISHFSRACEPKFLRNSSREFFLRAGAYCTISTLCNNSTQVQSEQEQMRATSKVQEKGEKPVGGFAERNVTTEEARSSCSP